MHNNDPHYHFYAPQVIAKLKHDEHVAILYAALDKLIRHIIYFRQEVREQNFRRSGSKKDSNTLRKVQASVIDLYEAQKVGSLPRFVVVEMLPNKKESGTKDEDKHIWKNSYKG